MELLTQSNRRLEHLRHIRESKPALIYPMCDNNTAPRLIITMTCPHFLYQGLC